MDTLKTVKGVSLFARTQSLEQAQRLHARKSDKDHKPSERFIAPMWISPEVRRRQSSEKE